MAKWIIIALTLGLFGCAQQPVKIRTETVEVVKPILFCPAVDFTEIGRPETLPIDGITSETSQGEIAVRYKATLKQLLDYINRLELTLGEYATFNKSYEELIQELELERDDQSL